MSDTMAQPAPDPMDTSSADPIESADRKTGGLEERLQGVQVPVTIVIGRKDISLRDLSAWRGDTLVSLDQSADAPLEVHVNGTCVATAELCEGSTGEGSLAIRILDVAEPSG